MATLHKLMNKIMGFFYVYAFANAERQYMKVEYRIREVTRYIVTRYHDDGNGGGGVARVTGEYDNAEMAYEVGTALARQEHSNLGYSIGDERIKYPEHPNQNQAKPIGES